MSQYITIEEDIIIRFTNAIGGVINNLISAQEHDQPIGTFKFLNKKDYVLVDISLPKKSSIRFFKEEDFPCKANRYVDTKYLIDLGHKEEFSEQTLVELLLLNNDNFPITPLIFDPNTIYFLYGYKNPNPYFIKTQKNRYFILQTEDYALEHHNRPIYDTDNGIYLDYSNTPIQLDLIEDEFNLFLYQTMYENVTLTLFKGVRRDTYKLYFSRSNNYLRNSSVAIFSVDTDADGNTYLDLMDIFSSAESNTGCGFMIDIIINSLFEVNLKYVTVNNQSGLKGDVRGTICYLKYIGKYFPIFSYIFQTKRVDLRDFENRSDWLQILSELGINIDYEYEDYYYFSIA